MMANQGVDFMFNVHAVNTNAVKLDIRLTGGHVTNKMTQMPKDVLGVEMDMNGSMALGHSMLDLYMPHFLGVDKNGVANYEMWYDPISIEDGSEVTKEMADADPNKYAITSVHQYILNYHKDHPNFNKYMKSGDPSLILDVTSTDDANKASSYYIGKSQLPKLQGGFGFDLSVYGVELAATFQYQLGGWGYDNIYAGLMHSNLVGKNNWHEDMYTNRWTEAIGAEMKEGELRTDLAPRLSNGADFYANSASDRFVISTNYISLANVSIGYSFPKKLMEKAKLNSLRLSLAADNLFCLSARQGFIPMSSMYGTSDVSQYSPLSSIIGTIKISF
jgi:hypothetical protein